MTKKHTTSSLEPSYVQYWDTQFAKLDLWWNWLICKTVVDLQLPEVQHLFTCNKQKAYKLIWGAFIASTHDNDNDNPMIEAYTNLLQSIKPEELPLFMCHINIGSSMHDGCNEKEATAIYLAWLSEKPSNRIYGKYQITDDFRSQKVPQHKRRR